MIGNNFFRRIFGSLGYLLVFVLLVALFLGAGAAGVYFATQRSSRAALVPSAPPVVSDNLPNEHSENQTLTVNAQLQVNGQFYLAPSSLPEDARAGTLVFDQATSTLQYFDGTDFVSLTAPEDITIPELGVTSLQGQTGAVTLTPGPGIRINGTTISNSGLLGINGVAGDINITTANGIATLSLPQSIDQSASPVFSGLSLGSPLGVPSGGTGVNSLTQNGVVIGGGSGPLSTVVAAGPGLCLLSTAGAPSFGLCNSGGSGVTSLNGLNGTLTLSNSSGIGTTITIDNASTSAKGIAQFNGTNFSVAAGVVNTAQNIHVSATPTFAGLTLNSPLSVASGGTGASSLTLNSVLVGNGTGGLQQITAGATGQCLVSTSGAPIFASCPGSGGVASIDGQTGTVTMNNATGSGGIITIDNASTSTKGIAQFNGTNFSVSSGIVDTIQGISVSATPTFAELNLGSALSVSSGGTGVGSLTSGGVLFGNGTGAISASSVLGNGQLLIGDGTGAPTVATLTQGSGIQIGNGAGSIGIAVDSTVCRTSGNCAGIGGVGDILQGGNSFTAAMTIGTNDNYGLNFETNGVTRFSINTSGDATLSGSYLSIGALNTAGGLRLFSGNASLNVGTLSVDSLTNSRIYTLPDTDGEICLDTGNCSGGGSGDIFNGGQNGAVTIGTNDANALAFETSGTTRLTVSSIGNITQSGGSMTLNGTSTGNYKLYLSGTVQNAGSSLYGLQNDTLFNASAASGVYGLINTPTIHASSGSIADVFGFGGVINFQAGYAGTVTNAYGVFAIRPTGMNGVKVSNYVGLGAAMSNSGSSGNSDNTSGTLNNYGLRVFGGSAAAGSGGTLNNYGARITLSTGSTTNTTNYGLYIDGNGGGSNNYALYSASTAASLFSGAVSVGGQLTVGTSDTTGTLLVLDTKTDTGDPSGTNGGMYYNSNSGKFRCYQAGGWVDCVGSGGSGVSSLNSFSGAVTLQGTNNQIIVNNNTGTVTLSTPQDIATNSTPTFAGLTLTAPLAVSSGGTGANNASSARVNLGAAASGSNADITGTTALNSIIPSGALTIGATSQSFMLQGTEVSTITVTDAGNTTILGFAAPTANTTLELPALSAGTYEICTSAGNCVGSGGSAPMGASYLTLGLSSSLTSERILTSGTNISFVDGGANGSLTVATVDNPTFSTSVTTPLLQSSGALNITPGGALTVGATGQPAVFQGAAVNVVANGAGNDVTLTAADALIVSTGGGEKLRVDSNGDLGIGQSNPTYRLDVLGSAAVNGEDVARFKSMNDAIIFKMGANADTENMLLSMTSNESASKDFAIGGFGLGQLGQIRLDAANTLATGTLTVTSLGTANTATYLCRNSSNQIASCNTTGTGAAFIQGGNSFGAGAILGTNDAQSLSFETGGTTRITIASTGMTTVSNGLTVSNSGVSSNSNITLNAIDGVNEGGQITINGAASWPNHAIDAYMGSLRVHSGGNVNLSVDSSTGNTGIRGTIAASGNSISLTNGNTLFYGDGVNSAARQTGSLYIQSVGGASTHAIIGSSINFYNQTTFGTGNGTTSIVSVNGGGIGARLYLGGASGGQTIHVENIGGTFRLVNAAYTIQTFGVDQSGNMSVASTGTFGGEVIAPTVSIPDSPTNTVQVCYEFAPGSRIRMRRCSSSSQRYKNTINTYSSGLDAVRQLHPVTFYYNQGYSADKDLQVGFIAEEVAAIDPLFAIYQNGVVESVRYDRITVLNTNAIKEIDLQVQSLQSKVNAHGSRLAVLETGQFSGNLSVAGNAQINGTLRVMGSVEVANLKVQGSLEANTIMVNGKIIAQGETPTSAVLSANTTDASIAIHGSDIAGSFTVMTDNMTPSDIRARIIFNKPYDGEGTPIIQITPVGASSVDPGAYIVSATATEAVIGFRNSLANNQNYEFNYMIVQSVASH